VLPSIRPAAVSLLLCSLAGCAKPAGFSSSQLAYCTQLYQLYFRYHTVITYAHNGQRAQAELALHACEQGDYAAGIERLTALLARDRVAVPPPPSGSGM
jgi:hypothetical protein